MVESSSLSSEKDKITKPVSRAVLAPSPLSLTLYFEGCSLSLIVWFFIYIFERDVIIVLMMMILDNNLYNRITIVSFFL